MNLQTLHRGRYRLGQTIQNPYVDRRYRKDWRRQERFEEGLVIVVGPPLGLTAHDPNLKNVMHAEGWSCGHWVKVDDELGKLLIPLLKPT